MENNTQFNQLMLADNSGLTVEEQQFKDLHNRICYNAQKAAEHLIDMAGSIREMRDTKRYKAAGFETFGEYTENALRIKERQAYNYIAVIENLPEAFIRAHSSLGVTKLALLTTVDDTDRQELMSRIDVEETSVRDITAEIKAITAEKDEAVKQLALMTEEKAAVAKENEQIKQELEAAKKAAATPEVVFQPDVQTVAELEDTKKRNKELEAEDAKKAARISELEGKLKAKKEKEEKKSRAEKEEAERKIKEMAAELQEAKAKKTTIADDSLLTFKVKFGDLQRVGSEILELLNGADEQTATKLRKAMNAVLTKWKEEMKL